MAAVFLMQPLGQLSATLIGYGVTKGLCQRHNVTTETQHEIIAPVLDMVWRIVIGVGAIPALLAVIARLSIPESPRFILDVNDNANEAIETLDRKRFARPDLRNSAHSPLRDHGAGISQFSNGEAANSQGVTSQPEQRTQEDNIAQPHERTNSIRIEHSSMSQEKNRLPPPGQQAPLEATTTHQGGSISRRASQAPQYTVPESWNQFFCKEGNWQSLAGTSLAWFCLDFVFFGLGINNPRTIAKIWADHLPPSQNSTSPPLLHWQDPYNPNNSIYEVLQDDAVHSMITVSIGSLVGSLLLVFFIDYIPRRLYLIISFGLLTGLFAIVGSTFLTSTFGNSLHGVTISMYVLCQLFFNFGK
jgi:PHS family inorganic phosphate transporter-like MFS transporter